MFQAIFRKDCDLGGSIEQYANQLFITSISIRPEESGRLIWIPIQNSFRRLYFVPDYILQQRAYLLTSMDPSSRVMCDMSVAAPDSLRIDRLDLVLISIRCPTQPRAAT